MNEKENKIMKDNDNKKKKKKTKNIDNIVDEKDDN